MGSWSINFKSVSKSGAAAKVVALMGDKEPNDIRNAILNAIEALPSVQGKVVQVITHGNITGEGGNVNIMVSLVSA